MRALLLCRILHTGESEFQTIELVESGPFGKVLLLDGKLQSAEADEFVYHESIVHPALLYHSNPKKVFIMGGGEGSTAREVLKHSSVKKVVMCDIDQVYDITSLCVPSCSFLLPTLLLFFSFLTHRS
jgi:thermospermine synthase